MMKELSLQNSRLDGRYDITSLLGRGSYAEIYVARDKLAAPDSPHRQVVIKALNVFMQNDLDADLERTLVENFQNEAVALDRVRHPNVVSRLGHGTARDLRGTVFHYLVLEYLSGGDLARLCRQKSINILQALKYIEQVCAGLGHAHKNGVIHRDIKPQNLLLTDDRETVKIADFGVARFSASDSPITRVGTNIYAPPEHSPMLTDGDSGVMTVTELTPAADVYSLAKSTYVLITCESPRFFANQPVKELPFDVRKEVWADDLLRILQKATQNNPKDRYQTVDEFWKELTHIKLLAEAESGEMKTRVATPRLDALPRAHVAEGYTPLAPQRPQFNTSRDLKLKNLGIPASAPNLVVKLDSNPPQQQPAQKPPPKNEEFLKTYIDEAEEAEPVRKKSFLRRAGVLLLFLAVFAGALFVTQSYLRNGRIFPEIKNPFVTPVGIAVNDVNLRNEANADSQKIGLVPKSSRVRIVNSKDNWYEIDVLEYGRPKENPADADHGWVNRRYIDIQE
ncbi:MAG TPA: serine/threonine protein kinase [Pyrinomonadaceae bacterium]|jgi:serine/threonine protein kinase